MTGARCVWQMRLPGGRWVVCGVVGCTEHPPLHEVPAPMTIAGLEIQSYPVTRVATPDEVLHLTDYLKELPL